MRYRLLALDVDGTVLDTTGTLRPTVRQAVLAVQQRGVRVVLCTGRRFRTARPIAHALQLDAPMVVHNGAVVRHPTSGETLHQTYMVPAVYQQALDHLRQLGTPMVYVDAFPEQIDILTEDVALAHPFQRDYLQDNLEHCRIVPTIDTPLAYGVVMVSIMGDEVSLRMLRPEVQSSLGTHARVNLLINKNYRGHILEILHPTVSKWEGLRHIAAREGIPAETIVAVGDDENDLEMLRHAGLGIAMGNATDMVKAEADYVTGSNAEDGLVQAIERFLLPS